MMEGDDGPDSAGYPDDGSRAPEGHLACNSCRKRKLRCSREVPNCQHCRKTSSACVYQTKRGKPGMKTGAIENLHRRLDALERSVARQQSSLERLADPPPSQDADQGAQNILSLLVRELQRVTDGSSNSPSGSGNQGNGPSVKRRRIDYEVNLEKGYPDNYAIDTSKEGGFEESIKVYFSHVHPWIPMIHEGRFRARLHDESEQGKLHVLVQAIILASSRYVSDNDNPESATMSSEHSDNLRDWIVSKAMKQLSVENLQALVVIAFDDIGNGQASQAWPLVGSLTRMVEYLQLTVEHDEVERPCFSQPYRSLAPPRNWTEAEERRRVFWNVFALDRFCSVTMGWNTSLTSDDVNRRLPCDGITWRKENPVATPYFGIWDKSAGRIGNPIAFIPAHPVPPQAADEDGRTPSEAGTSPGVGASAVDMSSIGAFAYCIEATESLSRVTSYFLQQKVNINNQRELSDWLTRFKELDLRLVHWKMLLPQKWKVNIVQDSVSRMDPNLTLAHVTHNASMILLHQPIAFPPQDWPFGARLPSLCSVDTCLAAATEIATITDHYLKYTPAMMPLSNQFAFCVYIAARVFLLHWRHGQSDGLTSEFWQLIQHLDAMSKRWTGIAGGSPARTDLATAYSSVLVQLHTRCIEDQAFCIHVPGYTTEAKQINRCSQPSAGVPSCAPGEKNMLSEHAGGIRSNSHQSSQFTGDAANASVGQPQGPQEGLSSFPPTLTPQSVDKLATRTNYSQQPVLEGNSGGNIIVDPDLYHSAGANVAGGDLTALSQMLLDQQFADMDRVISYDDGIFGCDYEGGGW